MKCTITGCPGDCERRPVTHTVRRNGRVVVIDRVPAEVCTVCGDVLLSPETVRHIELLLRNAGRPAREVPLYEYI
jgi:HTH-type transcriptional regulator/antitoxin MqsA